MSTEQLHELAVIDSQIDDYQTLVDAAQADGMEVILLSGEDGIDELADALADQTDIDALHLFTHGSQGQLQIGDDNLSSTTLDYYAEELALIKGSLSDNGDILLYGCNVAEGDVGEDFIEQLALVTGGDIAASDDLTGNSELGGDWELEHTVGKVMPQSFQARSFTNTLFNVGTWSELNNFTSNSILLDGVKFLFASNNEPFYFENDVLVIGGSGQDYEKVTIVRQDGELFTFDSIDFLVKGSYTWSIFSYDVNDTKSTVGSGSGIPSSFTTYTLGSDVKKISIITNGYVNVDNFIGSVNANLAPTIYIDATPTYNEGTPVTIDSNVTIADTDGVDTDLDDGYISFQITSGNTTNDRLILDTYGAVSLSGTTVSVSGTDVGTLVDSSGTTSDGTVENGDVLRINFNSSITGAMAETIAESIQFSNTSDAPNTSNRTVTYTISDGTDTGTGTATVAVTSINDAPSVSTNSGLTVNEGAVGRISDSILNTTDPDDSGAGLTYTITTGTGYGSVWIDTDGNNEINGGESALAINGTFTQQDINDGKVKYLHNGSEPANESFVFSVQDGGENSVSAITGQTFSITVNQVNDAPTATGIPASVTVNEDTASNVDLSDVSFADAEDNNLTVTLSTSAGTLTATSKDSVTVGGSGTGALTLSGSVASINAYLDTAANIQYTGATNAAGVNAASLTIAANDGTVNPTLGTVNIDITAVNDAPTITDSQSYSMTAVNEETASSAVLVSTILADSNINYADVDTGANSGIAVTATTGTGTWEFSTDNSNWTSFGTVSSDSALLLDKDTYVRFTGGTEYSGTANFSFRAWDQTSGGAASINGTARTDDTSSNGTSTAYSSDVATTSIVVNAVDDTPTLAGTLTLSADEDVATAMDLSGVTVADVDTSGDLTLTISVSDTSASLTATGAGSTINNVDVAQTNAYTVTLTGTVSELNGYLGTEGATNITYTTSSNTDSDDTLSIVANDGNSNSVATNTTIDVIPINDAPTVSATGDNATAGGAGSAVSVFSSTTIDAIENENIASVTFTVTGLSDTGSEKLNYDGTAIDLLTDTAGSYIDTATNGLISYAVAVSGSTATVTLKGPAQASAANTVFQTALNSMTYENTESAVTTGDRVFTITNVTDEGLNTGDNSNSWTTGGITSTVNVVNGETPIAATTSYSGTEDTTVDMATAGMAATQEINGADGLDYITITGISGGSLVLTGSPSALGAATAAEMANAGALTVGDKVSTADIGLIDFTPTQDSTTSASVTYTVTDAGSDVSSTGTITINLAAVNDTPTLSGVTSTITALEDTATNLITGTPLFADVDTTGDIVATLTATNSSAILTASDANGVVVGNSGTNAITLTGTASKINTFLQTASNVTYTGASNSTTSDTVTISVYDGEGGTGTVETLTVNFTAVNDEPVVSATGTGGNSINGAATDLFNSTTIDVDTPDSGDLVTSVTLTVSGLQDGADERINIDSTAIALTAGTTGTTTGGSSLDYSVAVSGTTATVTITHAGIAEGTLETALDAMTYENTSGTFSEGDRVITITEVQDDGDTANSGDDTWSTANISATVTVVDGTKPTATNYTDSANEDTTVSLSATELPTGSDSDSETLEYITIDTSKVVGGTLSLDSAGTADTSTIGGVTYHTTAGDLSGIVNINIADISKLDFTPTTNLAGTGVASFEWTVTDAGGQSSPTATYTLDLTNTPDAPEGTDKTVSIQTTQTYTFSASDFGFSDVDTGDVLNRVQIHTQSANGGALTIDNGDLTLDGVAVSNDDWINVADISKLVYDPSGAGTDTFTFTVEDDSTSNLSDSTPNTITLSVTTPSTPTTTPPSTTTQIDGTDVTTTEEQDEEGNTIQTVTVTPVSSTREDTDTTTNEADIPLHYANADTNQVVTSVSLPTGVGVTTRSNTTASTQNKLNNLIALIDDSAEGEEDLSEMENSGNTFLEALSNTENLWVNQIELTSDGTSSTSDAIKITGSSDSTYQEALVIDTRNLPASTVLDLNDIEFAVIVGTSVTIRGGEGSNIVYAGANAQNIVLGAEDDELHGGAGDDLIGSKGGADILYGDSGNDLVVGGMGDDTLYGGTGDDVLQGGQSAQGQISFALNAAGDIITTFVPRDADFSDTLSQGFTIEGDWYTYASFLDQGVARQIFLTKDNLQNLENWGMILQADESLSFIAQQGHNLMTLAACYQAVFGVLPSSDSLNELYQSNFSLAQIGEIGYQAWYNQQDSSFDSLALEQQVDKLVSDFTGSMNQELVNMAIEELNSGVSWSELFLKLAESNATKAYLTDTEGTVQLTSETVLNETTLSTDIGDDTLYGGDGNDTLIGGHGSDLLDGGDGIDTALMQHALTDYIVQQQTDGSVTLTYHKDDYIEVDTLVGIEFVQFGTQIIGINDLVG